MRTHQLQKMTELDTEETPEYSLFYTQGQNTPAPILVTLKVNGINLEMELDTGATLSVISEQTYHKLFSAGKAPPLKSVTIQLTTYTGEAIETLGEVEVTVQYKGQEKRLKLLVVTGEGPSLLGRNWLSHIKLDWSQLNHLQTSTLSTASCQPILDKHKSVFEKGLGTIKGVTAKFHIDPEVQPRFYKARPVPYALQPKVEAALKKLEKDDVIKPVQFSQWAAPIVPVVKPDGSIRICGDYKVTLNRVAKTDTYPLPKIEDLFTSLSGGKFFRRWTWLVLTCRFHLMNSPRSIPPSILIKDYTATTDFLLV